jgi:periplasmic protein TonB
LRHSPQEHVQAVRGESDSMSKAKWLLPGRPVVGSLFRPNHTHVRISKGIAGSLCLHSLALAMGVSVALQTSEPKIVTQSSTFRWDVSLVTAPVFEPVTSDVPDEALSAPPQEHQSPPSQNFRQAALSDSPNHSSRLRQESSLKSKKQTFTPRKFESLANGQPIPTMSSEQDQAVSPSGKSASHPQPEKRKTNHLTPFTQGLVATLPPPVEKVMNQSDQVRQPAMVEVPRVLQRPRAFQRQVRIRETKPDYGWLIHDLRTQLERLKFYPQRARLNKWEGKVVIQMKIHDDGHLSDAAVEESSGFPILDQTALAIIHQASPLELDHPLLAKTVILSVPLTFRLE